MNETPAPPLDQDAQKRLVARYAAQLVEHGMILGIGTGSTASYTVRELAVRWHEGLRFTGVATSRATERLATSLGMELATIEDVSTLDLALDGADEVDPNLDLIKGLGGALLREKLVEIEASRFAVMVDETKLVDRLGKRAPVPVEVVRFGHARTAERLSRLGLKPILRGEPASPYLTDSGHVIYDCRFEMGEVRDLARHIKATSGVVDHGLFLDMATEALIGHADGSVERRTRSSG